MNKYLKLLMALLTTTLVATAAFNRIIDPYGLFASPKLEGINLQKPETKNRQRLSKAYQLNYIKPEVVILGTSRALNLNINQDYWHGLNVYNLALASSSIYENYRYLQHAQSISPLKTVIIGLDYFMFGDHREDNYRTQRLNINEDGSPNRHLLGVTIEDLLPSLLSLDALRSSIKTIRYQRHQPKIRQQRVSSKGGHHAMFVELERGIMEKWGSHSRQHKFSEIGTIAKPGSFRKLLRLAYQSNIDLRLFISPSHARFWEAWEITGVIDDIKTWKRALVTAIEEEATLAQVSPASLIDFSGYNRYTTESLPEKDDALTLMFGYWEGSHYTSELGDLVIKRLYNDLDEPFGVAISAQNIEQHLRFIQDEGVKYRTQNPQVRKELEALMDEVRSRFQ